LLDYGTVNAFGDAMRADPGFEALPSTDPHACAVGKEVAGALHEALEVMTAYQARCLRAALHGLKSVESAERQGKTARGIRHALLRGRRTFEAVAARLGVETTCH
jgi:hypothetical protein